MRLCSAETPSLSARGENETLEHEPGRRRGDERVSDSGRRDLLLLRLILSPGWAGMPENGEERGVGVGAKATAGALAWRGERTEWLS